MPQRLLAMMLAVSFSVGAVAQGAHKRPVAHPASCTRHDNVGFFVTAPEILGELTQVYANCYQHPACASPSNQEIISIDGYQIFSNWPWSGLSTHTFSIAEQDSILTKTLSLAGAAAPPGKVIVGITFSSASSRTTPPRSSMSSEPT